jgi:solute carrier family 35 protein F5
MIQMSTGAWGTLFGNLFPTSEEALATKGKFAWGFFLIFLQCIILVANAMLTQYIFQEQNLESPFIMTYIGISSMAITLPIHACMEWRRAAILAKEDQESITLEAPSFDSFADDMSRYEKYSDIVDIAARRTLGLVNDHVRPWNHRKHFVAALLIAPAMFLADWAFNAALLSTSVASSTVLISIQSIFVYVLAVVLSLELYSNWKVVGILAGIAGTALTAIHDGNNDADASLPEYAYSDVITYTYNATAAPEEFEFPTTNTWGDTLALLAAVCYATYTIQVRLFCPENEDLYSMHLLLGYIGLAAMVPMAPLSIWLLVSEQIHMDWWTLFLVLVKGVFDFLITDYLLFKCIILTGPTVASVGLGMSIPFAFLGDVMMGREGVFSLYSLVGASACTLGFLIVNLAPAVDGDERESINESFAEDEPTFDREHVLL